MECARGVKVEDYKENFTIEIADCGVLIRDGNKKTLKFTASEALMLLDILKNEEKQLRKIAEESSPIQLNIRNYDDM
jgi:hypothetical protein